MKPEQEKCCGELLRSEVHTGALERDLFMHSSNLEEELLKEFKKLSMEERKNVISALLIFLSVQEAGAFDRQLIFWQN